MRIMLANRESPIAVEAWEGCVVNATRTEVSGGGFVHDVYRCAFGGSFDQAVERLLSYHIFPPHRMRACVRTTDGRVAVGATIVQRIFLGLFALESAVRVIEIERTPEAAVFAYATTVGHPEKGIASFGVRRHTDSQIFTAQAWSRPGNLISAIGRPVSRFLQTKLTKEAVSFFCSSSGRSGEQVTAPDRGHGIS